MVRTCPRCGADGQPGRTCARCRAPLTNELSGVDLAGADLSGLDLANADLRGANLAGAVLRDANLAGADLRGANLNDVDVHGTQLDNAQIDRMYSEYLTGVRFKGYIGKPAWVERDKPPPDEGRYAVNGYAIRCPCCGGEWFAFGPALLDRPGAFGPLGKLYRRATVLTCKQCSRIEWFRGNATARP